MQRLCLEGRTAGEQIVKKGAQRIDITLRADLPLFCFDLLGRQIARGAKHLAGFGEGNILLELFGQTKVGNARLIKFIDQDIGRL